MQTTRDTHKRGYAFKPQVTIAPHPMHTWAIDFLGPLPEGDHGARYVLVMIDCFSRFVELYATPNCTAESAADSIIALAGRYGCPVHLRSDQGSHFTAKLTKQLTEALHVDNDFVLPYHHQFNGIIERANGEVNRHLRAAVAELRDRRLWYRALPLVQHILNSSHHGADGFVPAEIMFGSRADTNRVLLSPPQEGVGELHTYMKELLEDQRRLIQAMPDARAQAHDDVDPTYLPNAGDAVVVTRPDHLRPSKLSSLYMGPYTVQEVHADQTFVSLLNLRTDKLETFHLSRVFPFNGQYSNADLRDIAARDPQEYTVEAIVDHRLGRRRRQHRFLVRWAGYSADFDEWLPYAEVRDLAALDAYLADHPGLQL
ncbi:Chromo (CHRromatin Organization MOdifier) domain [Carpediemonas membranifera]|uniref:Chromo (CHRromatin Organization MOdifier) domain n=1 Tax=Carpediemonas membranifera TaxID=201153 RepID=A0A8J6E539_9EUKA|nr:Chromo (CHRromatin Organization MOdifier) domain [Carpediemonas membranifera]|eukprot:KAG9395272.1 Chromo (CHRromatin Organization MOdifier) domain [Carpediemonas membranifera]